MKKILLKYMIIFSCILWGNACADSDNENKLLEDEQIQQQISELQKASESNRIIKSVTPIHDSTHGGWEITFTDTTSLEIKGIDSQKNITPFLKINEEGKWTVSYNNCQTFDLLCNNKGEPISAAKTSGKDIKHSISVNVTINEDSYYIYEIYESETNTVLQRIVTSYSSNKRHSINAIVQDKGTEKIKFTMCNGQTLSFAFATQHPTNITVLTKDIIIKPNEKTEVEFHINPDNSLFNPNEDGCISLNRIGTNALWNAEKNITTPFNYKLVSIEAIKDKSGAFKSGYFKAIIQDNGISLNYKEQVSLVINTFTYDQKPVQLSSESFYIENKNKTRLASIYITTPNNQPIKSKEVWIQGANIKIIDENDVIETDMEAEIKGRGNSTWNLFPKKPYTFRLAKRKKVLGMPAHKRWILLANWMDRTLIRNDVAFETARKCMEWAPHGRFVELYLNNKHQGNYYLCEKISIDKNRLDIGEITDANTQGENLTGGYILEFDVNYKDEPNYFFTKHRETPVIIKSPNEEIITDKNSLVFKYIENYINDVESLLIRQKFSDVYDKIDVHSYIDWWLVHELTVNTEPTSPKSVFMYKAKNGKLKAGPVWDFDWGTFVPRQGLLLTKALWIKYLLKDPYFRELTQKRWAELKPKFEEIPYFIMSQAGIIRESANNNYDMWPIDKGGHPNGDESLSFDDAIYRLKDTFLFRINEIDKGIQDL